MSKTNIDLVLRHHHELWSGGSIDSIGDYYAPDFVGHHPGTPDWVGPDHVREVMQRTRRAYPDFCEVVEDVVAERDYGGDTPDATNRSTSACWCAV